jgi:polysaccharide biosynthesis/export protein PslD
MRQSVATRAVGALLLLSAMSATAFCGTSDEAPRNTDQAAPVAGQAAPGAGQAAPGAAGAKPAALAAANAQAAAAGAAAKPQVPDASADNRYVLQAGDDLEVRAFNIPELTHTVKIRPDGRISLLLLNDVEAAGLTPSELGEALSKEYKEYYRNPRVTVIVRGFANRNVYVGGEVMQPRLIPLTGKMTIAGAIFHAGGFRDTAKTKEVVLLRDAGDGKPTFERLDLNDILNKGKPDVELKPFDVVFVPKSKIAKLDQFMSQYVKQLMPLSINYGFNYVLGQQAFRIVE